MTPEWISATAAIISIPLSVWAILSARNNAKKVKQVEKRMGIIMEGNTNIGSGTMLNIGD